MTDTTQIILSIPGLCATLRASDKATAELARLTLWEHGQKQWRNAITDPPPIGAEVAAIWIYIEYRATQASVDEMTARLVETDCGDMFCYNGQKWRGVVDGEDVQVGPPKLWAPVGVG